jgi:cyanophycinase-like exopeptidase
VLVIMGSGETAPTMVKPHRTIFERVGQRPAILLDTPYGFQENADDISSKAVSYFATSVGRTVGVVGWRTPPPPGLDRERALSALREAGWIFAGPGSPTYAMRQWRDTPIPDAMIDGLDRDGVVVFASAAALTLGSHTVPVYEIYKAGADPHWVPGLNLVELVTGLPTVVIPHYDNAEGGHHDTRYCYLGERRLAVLERDLPDGSFVLGVDEHTAVLLDLASRLATVVGKGRLTVRRHGLSTTYPSGTRVSFDHLATATNQDQAVAVPSGSDTDTVIAPHDEPSASACSAASSLGAAAETTEAAFNAALKERDVDGCVTAILDLEQARRDWATDTLTSNEGELATAALRRMVVRLGELAEIGSRDPDEALGPFVAMILELRHRARSTHDYATSDWIRDGLQASGLEVRDTPGGVEWLRA